MSHALACPHGLSLMGQEHNMIFQGKLEYPVYQTEWSDFDRFSFHRRRTPTTEIGPTSTQVVSGRGKARTMANLGVSGSGDG
jgi:hypothetical protein